MFKSCMLTTIVHEYYLLIFIEEIFLDWFELFFLLISPPELVGLYILVVVLVLIKKGMLNKKCKIFFGKTTRK